LHVFPTILVFTRVLSRHFCWLVESCWILLNLVESWWILLNLVESGSLVARIAPTTWI
jgi:hypothetical protein